MEGKAWKDPTFSTFTTLTLTTVGLNLAAKSAKELGVELVKATGVGASAGLAGKATATAGLTR